MDTIYITGHRNPDTDSIVSAMAYAALKNALGDRQYQAARLGQISDETQAVLNRFGAQPPMLITNLRTQVQDLDYDTPPILSPGVTVSRAWQMMQKDKLSVLPIANEDGTLYGMISAGDVANNDVASVRNPVIQDIPVYNLRRGQGHHLRRGVHCPAHGPGEPDVFTAGQHRHLRQAAGHGPPGHRDERQLRHRLSG